MTGADQPSKAPLAAVSAKPPAPRKALWRQAFDTVERAAAPRLEHAVQSEQFMDALTLLTRTRRGLGGLVERRTQGVWHLLNLPAGSDVRRLREQLVDLDRQLSTVTTELHALRRAEPQRVDGRDDNDTSSTDIRMEGSNGARRPDTVRRRTASPPRGRAGRAPGP